MITRITDQTIFRSFQSSIVDLEKQIFDTQNEVATQKKIHDPSDDPNGAAQVNTFRGETSQLNTFKSGVGFGTAVLSTQDGALGEATNILTRAQEVATQMADGLTTPGQRQVEAQEVTQLEQALLSLGNTNLGGRYVFGGLATGAAPFASVDDPGFNAATAYSGPTDPFSIRIATDQTVRLTTPGDQVFGQSIVALDNLRQALNAGNAPTTSVDELNAALQSISSERASVGGRLNELSSRDDQISSSLTTVQTSQSHVEDADPTQSISLLVQLQNALQATLASGNVLKTSILDYVSL